MEFSVFFKVNKSFCPGIVQLTETVIQLVVSLFSPVTSRLFIPLDFDTKLLSLLKKVLKIAKVASSGNVFG